jgi:hypothetical protein
VSRRHKQTRYRLPRTAKPRPAFYDFVWLVPTVGFDWFKVHRHEHGYLVEGDRLESPYRLVEHSDADVSAERRGAGSRAALLPIASVTTERQTRPFQEFTGLFMSFAELAPTPEAIRAFANEHGTLDPVDYLRRMSLAKQFVNTTVHASSGEIVGASWFEDWLIEIQAVKHVANEAGYLGTPPNRGFRSAAERLAFVQGELQNTLRNRLRPHVELGFFEGGMEPMPTTLRGAIWMQLAMAVSTNKQFRRCIAVDCPRGWFEVSRDPFGLRPEARFCSRQCRSRSRSSGTVTGDHEARREQ